MRYEVVRLVKADGSLCYEAIKCGNRRYAEDLLGRFDANRQGKEQFTLREIEEPSDRKTVAYDDDDDE